MALAQGTDLMLLDEPTTFLDLAHQVDILDLLVDLNQRDQRTVVLVLHDLNHAARYSHHLIAMRDGRIVAQGTPAEVITEELVHDVFGLALPGHDRPGVRHSDGRADRTAQQPRRRDQRCRRGYGMTMLSDAPTPAAWLATDLAAHFDARGGPLDGADESNARRWYSLDQLLADDAAVLHSIHEQLMAIEKLPARAASTYLASWIGGGLADAIGFALAKCRRGLLGDSAGRALAPKCRWMDGPRRPRRLGGRRSEGPSMEWADRRRYRP